MARDVGNYQEVCSVIRSLVTRESDENTAPPKAQLDTPYEGGKVSISGKDFQKPSTGTIRKHLEG